jgi:2-amino-4-hydroxy-6-hydroxymethyldihydropteridine diphosphokinase
MSSCCLIGLGSNLGDRRATLLRAIEQLDETPRISVTKVSSFHETEPVGGPEGQGPYLNAAACIETTLEPPVLLEVLKAIENNNGRVRREHWGARTLDLDLLLFGDRVIETADLTIPHPLMAVRRFVLEPLVEIAPCVVHPATGRTIAQMLEALNREARDGQEGIG